MLEDIDDPSPYFQGKERIYPDYLKRTQYRDSSIEQAIQTHTDYIQQENTPVEHILRALRALHFLKLIKTERLLGINR